MFELKRYIEKLVSSAPDVREIWLIGSRANDSARSDSDWDLLVFGGDGVWHQLRMATAVHLPNVDCLVVRDGAEGRFETAWGASTKAGSLSGWKWEQIDEHRARYVAKHWVGGQRDGELISSAAQAWLVWPSSGSFPVFAGVSSCPN